MIKEFHSNHIVELNRDAEAFLIQACAGRPKPFHDAYQPLQFVHFSDLHAKLELWNRMVEYINYYSDYISFAIHSGDYCGSSQLKYEDCYRNGNSCKRPIYNCVGNHDVEENEDWSRGKPKKASKESVYRLLFHSVHSEEAIPCPVDFPTAYCLDYEKSKVRLIVLDQYYDIEIQKEWLRELLKDAKEKGLHVMTVMHEPSDDLVDIPNTTFHSLHDYRSICGAIRKNEFEDVLVEFIQNGGIHICNLVGHEHHDLFGYTKGGVLNCAVECATDWNGWCDGKREKGTKTWDSFNVVSVDANLGLFKLVRIGNTTDPYLRSKRTLCFDYMRKRVISNA